MLDTLPDTAPVTVALIADWGTGMPIAQEMLAYIAATEKPDVVIHLGDIYYAGTERETTSYFLSICNNLLPGIPVYTIPGNHEMYSGGQSYYNLIDALGHGQKASYFCLRNKHWQFLGMDTGLHDHDPFTVATVTTFLDPKEVEWHLDKIQHAGGRRTVLLSHHQPFSAFSTVGSGFVNELLLGGFSGALSSVDLWLWGHEHCLYIYDSYKEVAKGRCIGCGAVPVAVEQEPYKALPGCDIPFLDVTLDLDADANVYYNGYAIMKLTGPTAQVVYKQYPDPNGKNPLYVDDL